MLADIDTGKGRSRLKPIPRFVRQLTLGAFESHASPGRRRVRGRGWTERDLYDAVLTVGLFNLDESRLLPKGMA